MKTLFDKLDNLDKEIKTRIEALKSKMIVCLFDYDPYNNCERITDRDIYETIKIYEDELRGIFKIYLSENVAFVKEEKKEWLNPEVKDND